MRKSRKSPASILRFGPLALAVLLCGFFATAGIGYTWNRNRNEQLQREIAKGRRVLDALQKENQQLEFQGLELTRPEVLYERAKALGLVRPDPSQILRVEIAPVGSAGQPAPAPVRLAARAANP